MLRSIAGGRAGAGHRLGQCVALAAAQNACNLGMRRRQGPRHPRLARNGAHDLAPDRVIELNPIVVPILHSQAAQTAPFSTVLLARMLRYLPSRKRVECVLQGQIRLLGLCGPMLHTSSMGSALQKP